MLFNSVDFLVFFASVFLLFYVIPKTWQWGLLLAASWYFYAAWKWPFIFLLLTSTLVDYFAGLGIAATESRRRKRLFLALSLFVNLGLLFYFKYAGFFTDVARQMVADDEISRIIPNLNPLLPVGISFYTFQTLGYTIDVYRGVLAPQRHFGKFALYVAYFPQLVAGPIERAQSLIPQLDRKVSFDYDRVVSGARMAAAGLFKKVVIADNLGVLVDRIYDHPQGHQGLPLVIATVAFTYQLFCDFSGYSDMAVGLARMLGVDLIRNFDRPFFTKNLSHFWRRCHTSLGLWFREYIYIPLGGNRRGPFVYYRNIFIVFVLSGFWHGASWNYLAWGASQAVFFILGSLTLPLRDALVDFTGLGRVPRLLAGLQHLKVFFLYTVSMVFFRAATLGDAGYVFTHLHQGLRQDLFDGGAWWSVLSLSGNAGKIIVVGGFILIMEIIHGFADRFPTDRTVARLPGLVRWTIYLALIYGMLLFGEFSGHQFIYFQF